MRGCNMTERSLIAPGRPAPQLLLSPVSCPPQMASTSSLPPSPANYELPTTRLQRTLRDGSKTPIALVACGSFSPITYLHLRMFEMAVDYVRQSTDFEVVAGYLSPVSDAYQKPGLLSAAHRSVRPRAMTPVSRPPACACASSPSSTTAPGSWSTRGKPRSPSTSAPPSSSTTSSMSSTPCSVACSPRTVSRFFFAHRAVI